MPVTAAKNGKIKPLSAKNRSKLKDASGHLFLMQLKQTYFVKNGWWTIGQILLKLVSGGMENMKNQLSMNLTALRKMNQYTQEEVASRIGVSRQAVAKWESGESAPDIINCNALAEMYNVSLDDLVNYNEKERDGLAIPPKDKHMFGCVSVGERGQIVIPKKAREIFDIKPGDRLMVLGDEDPERAGIAIVKEDVFMELAAQIMDAVKRGEE